MTTENRSHLSNSDRKKRGFTLFEVMLSVAIIIVLLALAAPNVISARKSMEIVDLEAAARQIYLAAQNRLTVLKVSGNLNRVDPDNGAFVGGTAVKITEAPEDFPAGDWDGVRLYSTDKTTGGLLVAELLEGEEVAPEVFGGHFTLEYDPVLGTVYGVFFSEDSFAYDTVKANRTSRISLHENDPPVGYYGGGAVATLPPQPEIPDAAPVCELINAKDLYLKINCDTSLTYVVEVISASAPGNFKKYTSTIDGGKTGIYFENNTNNVTKDGEGNIIVTLDSLLPATNLAGRHFRNIGNNMETVPETSGKPDIPPGDNIIVSVRSSRHSSAPPHTLSDPWTSDPENSLFALKSGTAAELKNGRHLQNLATRISGLPTTTGDAITAEYLVYKAEVKATIDWVLEYGSAKFETAINDRLRYFDGGSLSGYTISNLKIGPHPTDTRYVGMLGSFPGPELSAGAAPGPWIRNVDMVSADVDITDSKVYESVGLMAGDLGRIGESTEVSGCDISGNLDVAPFTSGQANFAGVLAGRTTGCNISAIGVENTAVDVNASAPAGGAGRACVGGIIGRVSGGSVNTLNANNVSVNIDGGAAGYYGGVIGSISGNADNNRATLSNSNANNVSLTGNGAGGHGGFVGYFKWTNLTQVYNIDPAIDIVGNIAGRDFAGGFAGKVENSTLSYVGARKKDNALTQTITLKGDNVGGLVGESQGSEFTKCYSSFSRIDAACNVNDGLHGIGGLVGGAYNSRFTDCYANTKLLNGTFTQAPTGGGIYGKIAGFAGEIKSPLNSASATADVSRCYSMGKIVKVGGQDCITAGFAGVSSGATIFDTIYIANSYAAVEIRTSLGGGNRIYGFAYNNGDTVKPTFTGCYYSSVMVSLPPDPNALTWFTGIRPLNEKDKLSVNDLHITRKPAPLLGLGTISGWVTPTAPYLPSPYNMDPKETFNFPGIQELIHYGDWPLNKNYGKSWPN